MSFGNECQISLLTHREILVECDRPSPVKGRVVRYDGEGLDLDCNGDVVRIPSTAIKSVKIA